MFDPAITLEPAAGDELQRVEALLESNDLPTDDVQSGDGRFYLALADGKVVGTGGLEIHGSDGLLRSLVVEDRARGEGFGLALCTALEARARDEGVEKLYLLTTTAAGFFRRCGYEEIERVGVPVAIRKTAEFRELCPDSATCMTKQIR